MRTYLQDKVAAILVSFVDGGEPFIPVSASWTLRDHSGAEVTGYIDTVLTLGPADTDVLIQVPALKNAITSPREFEKRTIVVSAMRGTSPWQAIIPYRITPWLNHTVTLETIRSLAGLTPSSLLEDDVDIWNAYKILEARLGAATFATALSSGTKDESDLNRAIASLALLDALPAVENRMLKRKTDGSIEAERFQLNFDELKAKLQKAVDEVVESVGGVIQSVPALFSFGLPTDVVTGS